MAQIAHATFLALICLPFPTSICCQFMLCIPLPAISHCSSAFSLSAVWKHMALLAGNHRGASVSHSPLQEGLRTPPRCKWKSCPQIGSGFWLDFRGALRLQNTCGVDCSESPCTSEHLLDVTGSCFWSRSCFFSEARTEHPW